MTSSILGLLATRHFNLPWKAAGGTGEMVAIFNKKDNLMPDMLMGLLVVDFFLI